MFFKQSATAACLFFRMRSKFCSHVFIAINIPCKFGEDIFINELDIKVTSLRQGVGIILYIVYMESST